MKPIFFLVLLLASLSYACKCFNEKGNQYLATKDCCKRQKGKFVNDDDCNAGSISNALSRFAQCCANYAAFRSDCHCSISCGKDQNGDIEATGENSNGENVTITEVVGEDGRIYTMV